VHAAFDKALRHRALAAANAASQAEYPGFHNANAVSLLLKAAIVGGISM